MTVWRSSLLRPATRTWSDWIDACTLSLRSLMALTISLAFSVGIPCWTLTVWRTVPPAASSTFPKSSDLIATPRLTSLPSRMSTTDLSLWALSEVSVRVSSFSFHSIFEALPRKSKRVAISLEACWTALETSCSSTRDTTSKENSWAMGAFYGEESQVQRPMSKGARPADSRARTPGLVFDDPRSLGSGDPIVRIGPGLLTPPSGELELGAVAGFVLVRQPGNRTVGGDCQGKPGELGPRRAGLQEQADGARGIRLGGDLVGRGQPRGIGQKEHREPGPLLRGELLDRELLVLGSVEPGLAGVVSEGLLLRDGVVETQPVAALDPDLSRFLLRRLKSGRGVEVGEGRSVRGAVDILGLKPRDGRLRVGGKRSGEKEQSCQEQLIHWFIESLKD